MRHTAAADILGLGAVRAEQAIASAALKNAAGPTAQLRAGIIPRFFPQGQEQLNRKPLATTRSALGTPPNVGNDNRSVADEKPETHAADSSYGPPHLLAEVYWLPPAASPAHFRHFANACSRDSSFLKPRVPGLKSQVGCEEKWSKP